LNTCIDYYQNTGDMFFWESKYGIPLMHKKEELTFREESRKEFWQQR